MDKRINFLCKVANGVSELLLNKEKEKKQFFVKEIYEETKRVYQNFYEILNYAYSAIEAGEMSIDEAVKYLNDERLPFKTSRDQLRGFMKHPYYQRNQELEWFNVGIRGVLCGGLHGLTEYSLKKRYKDPDKFADIIIPFKGCHTIMEIIKSYDRNNMDSLFYSDLYANLSEIEKEKEIKERLLEKIKWQIQKIDESWKIVCDNYPKIMF